LVCEDSTPAFWFAYRLCKQDRGRKLLSEILDYQAAQEANASTSFLSGYLRAIFDEDVSEWESVMVSIAKKPGVVDRFSDVVIASGLSDRVAKKVVELCRSGAQDIRRLQRWWFSPELKRLNVELVDELLRLQLEDSSGRLWSNAVHMCHTYFMEN